jgi:methionine-rich copper-binding protein CopC
MIGFIIAPALSSGAAFAMTADGPQYLTSEPADGARVHRAPKQVRVVFTEPLEEGSRLRVFNECGTRVDAGKTRVTLNEVRVRITDRRRRGIYRVRYVARGIAGLTGKTSGTFSFLVHRGKRCNRGAVPSIAVTKDNRDEGSDAPLASSSSDPPSSTFDPPSSSFEGTAGSPKLAASNRSAESSRSRRRPANPRAEEQEPSVEVPSTAAMSAAAGAPVADASAGAPAGFLGLVLSVGLGILGGVVLRTQS